MNIEQLRAAKDAAIQRMHECKRAIDEAAPETPAATVDQLVEAFNEAVAEVERTKKNLETRERLEQVAADNPVPAQPATARGSLRQELTYRPDMPERSFFMDAYAAERMSNSEARERMQRNAREQYDIVREKNPDAQLRDVGTGAFTGLVVPQYLVDLAAPIARAGSPVLNAISNKLQLPASGLTLNISRITTGTAVAAQSSENSGVQETDADDTLLSITVQTFAGQQDVSRQAIERGTMIDQVIYNDLVRAYFTKIDYSIINDDGTSGTHLGILNTSSIKSSTYTDASPTVPELYPKVADVIQQINTANYSPATTIVMHPRRWGWMTAAVDGSNRPYVLPTQQGPYNALAVGDAAGYGQVVGSFHSLPVITDANLPTTNGAGTNEDVILVLTMPELLYWQEGDGMPRQFRFDQVAPPQSVRLAVWGYSAFTAGRYPAAAGKVSGTGLVAPSF